MTFSSSNSREYPRNATLPRDGQSELHAFTALDSSPDGEAQTTTAKRFSSTFAFCRAVRSA
jgi:hypothetical protein